MLWMRLHAGPLRHRRLELLLMLSRPRTIHLVRKRVAIMVCNMHNRSHPVTLFSVKKYMNYIPTYYYYYSLLLHSVLSTTLMLC
jgi:hypothetical protein